MVQAHMVGHKIQHQLQPMFVELPAELRQPSLASQCGRDLVIANRVRRAGDIRLLPTRQNLVVRAAKLGKL